MPNIHLNISVVDMSLKALEDTHQRQHIPLIHKSIWLGISGSPQLGTYSVFDLWTFKNR